jgi:glycosidase
MMMRPVRWVTLLWVTVGLSAFACAGDPSDPGGGGRARVDAGIAAGPFLDATTGADASGPRPDATPDADAGTASDAGAPIDAGAIDGGAPTDGGAVSDAGGSRDAGPPPDSGPRPDAGPVDLPPCDDVSFTFSAPNAQSVWLSGTFTGWAPNPSAGALELSRGAGGLWTITTSIPSRGRHAYKLIVDGSSWVPDPAAREDEPDGLGGRNSVVRVCARGPFDVVSHRTDVAARRFTATVDYRGRGDPASVVVSLDLDPVPAAAVRRSGDRVDLEIDGLSDGIHDVRVSIGDDSVILKAYVNETTDWRDTVLYFAMIDRFRNGDRSNDAPVGNTLPLADYMGGDFAGVLSAITDGWFEQLGVNAIWLTWPLDNPDGTFDGVYPTGGGCNPSGRQTGRFSGYHGYWPKSGRDIESRFGTMAELKTLVKEAHARGIRIVLDFTANHTHSESPYFQQHPEWFNVPPVMCGDGHWDSDLREECWFEPYLPDWKYSSFDAIRVVLDDAVWLAKETGADGFRVDALKHMEDAFVVELRRRTELELEQTGVTFYMVGETFTGDTGLINYYVRPDMVHAQFDFPANYVIRQGIARNDVGLDAVHRSVRGIKAAYGANAGLMSTFAGNHDIARFISKASGDLGCGVWSLADRVRAFDNPPPQPTDGAPYRRLEMAMAYTYAVPGIPLLYYGDEVGLAGGGDPDNRRMMPETSALNAEQQRTLTFMRRLGTARAENAVLRTGDWTDALWEDTTILVFARRLGNETALIVLNRGDARTIEVEVGGPLALPSGTRFEAALGQGELTTSGTRLSLNVPALSAEIWLRRP